MKKGRSRRRSPLVAGVLALGWSAGVGGCGERERLTFPNVPPGPESGPTTKIDRPQVDTTLQAGPAFFVTGRTGDTDGVDTVYFETEGGVSAFPPFVASSDTVRFGLPITTNGLAGETITVRIFGVDRLGNHGDTATRRLTIQ